MLSDSQLYLLLDQTNLFLATTSGGQSWSICPATRRGVIVKNVGTKRATWLRGLWGNVLKSGEWRTCSDRFYSITFREAIDRVEYYKSRWNPRKQDSVGTHTENPHHAPLHLLPHTPLTVLHTTHSQHKHNRKTTHIHPIRHPQRTRWLAITGPLPAVLEWVPDRRYSSHDLDMASEWDTSRGYSRDHPCIWECSG